MLKIFITTTTPVAAVLILADLATGDLGLHTLVRVAAIGVPLMLLFWGGQAYATRGTDQIDGARYDKQVDVSLPPAVAEQRIYAAAEALRASVMDGARNGYLRLRFPAGLKSWGEVVDVRLAEVDPGRTHVDLTSRSAFKPTVVDWGKNRQNVDALLAELSPATPSS